MLSSKLFNLSFLFIACSLGVAASPFTKRYTKCNGSDSTNPDNTTVSNHAPPNKYPTPTGKNGPPSSFTPTDTYTPTSSFTPTNNSVPTSSSSPPNSNTTDPSGDKMNGKWSNYKLEGGVVACQDFVSQITSDSQIFVAVSIQRNGDEGRLCGQKITLSYKGKDVPNVPIVDTCPGCDIDQLDLSQALFNTWGGDGIIFQSDAPPNINQWWFE